MSRWRPAHTLLVRVGPMTALPDHRGLRASVTQQITDRTAVLAGELGLPLVPQIEITLDELPGVEVGSDGQAVTASDLDLEEAWRLVAPAAVRPVPFGWEWQSWATTVRLLADAPDAVADFVAEVVAGLLQRRPDRLLTVRQAVAYLMHHGGLDARDVDPESFLRAAAPAVAQGVGIGDGPRVIDHLANDAAPEQLRVETLIAHLRARSVDVLVAPDLAADLSGPVVDSRFRLLGAAVFEELGVRVPDLRLVTDNALEARRFSVRVNALTGRPHRGLPTGTVMVDAPPEELAGRFGTAEPLRDPATGARCSAVSDRHADALRTSGRLLWTPSDHLLLTVGAELRRRAVALVDVRTVEYELARLHWEAPDLVLEALGAFGVGEITAVARDLVREGPGIRDLRRVLEQLVATAVLPDAGDRMLLASGGWPPGGARGALSPTEERTRFVRAGLAEALVHRHATESGQLPAVVVGRDVVQRLRQQRAHDRDRTTGRPLARAELGHLHAAARHARDRTAGPRPPVLLTTGEVRGYLASLLAEAVPDLAVLAFDELPPGTRVAWCGQLTLTGLEPSTDEATGHRRPR